MSKPKGESRGLAYLQKARPAAMEHLLKFFGESARHLDPRTRFLISVVTKVINFSPRGLEQYVKRALQEGASPDEVIDAVLCAYPCAGLTKVVDAIDVILEMRLPGFDEPEKAGTSVPADAGAPQPRWVPVANEEEIAEGAALHVVAPPFEIALFRREGRVLAIDHVCPHKKGPLASGRVVGNVVTCPQHGWMFHLETGESLNRPGTRVRTYPVRRGETGKIEVLLPESPAGDH